MLFLFAGTPPPPLPRDPKIHAYQPGVYHESLNPKSGDTIYLAPGAYHLRQPESVAMCRT